MTRRIAGRLHVSGRQRERLMADLRARYESGASIRALARQTGRSYGFVHGLLQEAGVALRRRGAPRRAG
jgi:hypothetical protein